MRIGFCDAVWVITEGNIFTQSGHYVLYSVSPPAFILHPLTIIEVIFPKCDTTSWKTTFKQK